MTFYDHKSGLNTHQCHERLVAAFRDAAPSFVTVSHWYREFRRGRDSLEDEARSGKPASAKTPESVARVRQMAEADRRVTYKEIEASLGLHSPAINKILHNHIGVRKLTIRWVPHLLKPE